MSVLLLLNKLEKDSKKKQDKDAKPQSCEKQEKRLINVQHYWRNFAQSYAKESEKEDKEKHSTVDPNKGQIGNLKREK